MQLTISSKLRGTEQLSISAHPLAYHLFSKFMQIIKAQITLASMFDAWFLTSDRKLPSYLSLATPDATVN